MTSPGAILRLIDVDAAPASNVTPVLRGVSFSVGPGECIALVGPSGSGKTTLLRTIGGALSVRAGTVLVDGEDLSQLAGMPRRRARARIAMITQRHDLVEQLRVDTNVMAGALGRWSHARALRYLFWAKPNELAEAEAALAAVGIADKLKLPTTSLSGGEQQRVAIARALIQEPRLLLADEPIASLDPSTAIEVLNLLTGLARSRGMGLIMSLHQPDFAARFADRALSVSCGKVVEDRGL